MKNLKYTEILQLNKELAKENYSSEFSTKILSNVTVNSFKFFARKIRSLAISTEFIIFLNLEKAKNCLDLGVSLVLRSLQ